MSYLAKSWAQHLITSNDIILSGWRTHGSWHLIFTVDEVHDQSAENSLSCPLNTDTGTDTDIPPSKWVIKPHQLMFTTVHQTSSDIIHLTDLFQPIDIYTRLSRGPEEISDRVSSFLDETNDFRCAKTVHSYYLWIGKCNMQ